MDSSAVIENDNLLGVPPAEEVAVGNDVFLTPPDANPTENKLLKTLNSLRLENRWNECLDTWEDADPEEVLEVHLMAAQVRQQFLDAAAQVSSEEELAQTTLLIYIQLKAHWYLLNLRLGYSAETGVLNQTLAYQASLLAILVLAVEATVGRQVVERVTAMLDSPMTDYDTPEGEGEESGGVTFASSLPSSAMLVPESGWATGAGEEEAGTLRGRVQVLADTLGDLSERLSRQSGEMLVMKATHGALTETLGESDPARLIARAMQLSAKIVDLEAQLESAGIHRQLFEREFGTSDPFAMATVVHSLRAQVASQKRLDSGETVESTLNAMRIEELTAALNSEREAKAQAQAHSANLEAQLQAFHADQAILASELGTADGAQIVAKVKGLTDRLAAVKDLEALLGSMESQLSGSP
jgi:hypothetical protein